MKKIFVLDTNVLLHEAESLLKFKDNIVILPMTVIEELDEFKKRQDEVGRNSRMVSRIIDDLRSKGNLSEGIELPEGGMIKIDALYQSARDLPFGIDPMKPDNQILAAALHYKRHEDKHVILLSKDINLRVKADALGLDAKDYVSTNINPDEIYSGVINIKVDKNDIDRFYSDKKLAIKDTTPSPNEFIFLEDISNPSHTALAKWNAIDNVCVPLKWAEEKLWGIRAKNREQRFAMDLLLDHDIQLVTLVGTAGTGKTLLALTAGLEEVVNNRNYQKLLVCRPIIPMGKDIGYLPGDVEEKLMPRMQPIADNLEFIFSQQMADGTKTSEEDLSDFIDSGIIQLEPLTYIRGRSIPNQYMIVDEAQNLTPHEMKTILTRAGDGTKIVLTGDPYQLDHPYLDSRSNGLTYAVERFRGEKLYGHIFLRKGERSVLAELAAKIL